MSLRTWIEEERSFVFGTAVDVTSIYATRVVNYGRRWYRPWLALCVLLGCAWSLHWLAQEYWRESDHRCEDMPGSRYIGSVPAHGLVWTADLEAGLACAFHHNRRVLVAFHAMSDMHSALNARNVFTRFDVRSAMNRYVLVMLYVDFVPEEYYHEKPTFADQEKDAKTNMTILIRELQTQQEPMYVVLRPEGHGEFETEGVYEEGRITDPESFIRFLHEQRGKP